MFQQPINRYCLKLLKGPNVHQLPDYFDKINKDVCVIVQPCKHFGAGFGEVIGCELHVTTKAAGMYICVLLADRCAPDALADFDAQRGDLSHYATAYNHVST